MSSSKARTGPPTPSSAATSSKREAARLSASPSSLVIRRPRSWKRSDRAGRSNWNRLRLLHEGTKRHEEHDALLYKIILRDLRDSSCLRDKTQIYARRKTMWTVVRKSIDLPLLFAGLNFIC